MGFNTFHSPFAGKPKTISSGDLEGYTVQPGTGTGPLGGITYDDMRRVKAEAYNPQASPYGTGSRSSVQDRDWARQTYQDLYEQFKARNPGLDFKVYDDDYFLDTLGIRDLSSSNDISQLRYAMEGFRPPPPKQEEPRRQEPPAQPPAPQAPQAPPPSPPQQLPVERKIEKLAGNPLAPETGKPKDAQKQEFLNRFLGGVDPVGSARPDTKPHLWEAYKSKRDAAYEAMLGTGASDYTAGFGGKTAGEYMKEQDDRRRAWDEEQRQKRAAEPQVDPRKFLDSLLFDTTSL